MCSLPSPCYLELSVLNPEIHMATRINVLVQVQGLPAHPLSSKVPQPQRDHQGPPHGGKRKPFQPYLGVTTFSITVGHNQGNLGTKTHWSKQATEHLGEEWPA